ncbi:MAG: hypothetical protein M3Z14_02785 [Candidatus Eremiobacteraeota bacterium]|nr:hypothetical protein [Candidatus Eremiobacteraeota bacterium]
MEGTLAIFLIFGAPMVALIVFRILAHRERMAIIERGLTPNDFKAGRLGGTGFSQPGHAPVDMYDAQSAQRSLRKGIILAAIGLALTIGLSFIGYDSSGGPLHGPVIEPGPWLLGGLIPMFVGIAQIIIAVLSGARIGSPYQFARVEPPSRFTTPPSDVAPGPHTYRSDDTTELKRPVPPPDILS